VGGYKRHVLSPYADEVKRKRAENKGITLQELRDWALETLAVCVHLSSIDRFVRSLGYRYKKTLRVSERARADVAEARTAWQDWRKGCDPLQSPDLHSQLKFGSKT
jgi:transposase